MGDNTQTSFLFVGSAPTAHGGRGGVSVRPLDDGGRVMGEQQVVALSNPSFLALGNDLLFASEEGPDGRVVSMSRNRGKLAVVAKAASGGGFPCHLVMDEDNGQLVIANYLSGTIASLRVARGGGLEDGKSTALPGGSGPVLDRQQSPHPHQMLRVPGEPEEWVVSDLGGDRVLRYEMHGREHAFELVGEYRLPSGSGPRHMGWVGHRLLVVGELDSQLHTVDTVDSVVNRRGAVSTWLQGLGSESTDPNLPSHMEISRNLKFAFVANRGRNSITVFDISQVSNDGLPVAIQEVSSAGDWPRHFAFRRNHLYVANQRSDTIAVFDADREHGTIGELTQVAPTGAPACLVFSGEDELSAGEHN